MNVTAAAVIAVFIILFFAVLVRLLVIGMTNPAPVSPRRDHRRAGR